MRRWLLAGLLTLVLGGCREAFSAADPDAGSLPGPVPPVRPKVRDENQSLPCDLLVGPAVRVGFLEAWDELPDDGAAAKIPGAPRMCRFEKGANGANQVRFAFDCRRAPQDSELERMVRMLVAQAGTEVPGLGRAAVRQSPKEALQQVTAWDTDSPCYVLVTWLGEGNQLAPELVRAVLDGLKAELVAP